MSEDDWGIKWRKEQQAKQPTEKEMKLAIQYYDSQSQFLDKASSSQNFTSNLEGLLQVFTSPILDFFGMIINPFMEQLYPKIARLLNDLTPILEDLAGDVGELLGPIFEGLAELMKNLQPALDFARDFLKPFIDLVNWLNEDEGVLGALFGSASSRVAALPTAVSSSALENIIDWISGFF